MTATQAPTPGPLSVGQEETVAFNLCAVHGFDPDFVKTQRDFALAVIREYEVVCRPRLAPTAPVEASGSERDGPEVGEDAVAKILAPYLPTINSTPDLLSILYDADLMPEQTVTVRGAICVVAVCEAYKAAIRPQPSGETREQLAAIMQRNIITNEDGGFSFHDLKAADEILSLIRPAPVGGEGCKGCGHVEPVPDGKIACCPDGKRYATTPPTDPRLDRAIEALETIDAGGADVAPPTNKRSYAQGFDQGAAWAGRVARQALAALKSTAANANTSGLENAGHIVWWKAGGVSYYYYPEGEAFTVSKSCRVEPLVTAASAQARIEAADARADRLAKALEEIGNMSKRPHEPGAPYQAARAALQQETQP